MNFIDIIILFLFCSLPTKGLKRGIIKELISLLSLVLGIYIPINSLFYWKTIFQKIYQNMKSLFL